MTFWRGQAAFTTVPIFNHPATHLIHPRPSAFDTASRDKRAHLAASWVTTKG